jgi:hypothetical protein
VPPTEEDDAFDCAEGAYVVISVPAARIAAHTPSPITRSKPNPSSRVRVGRKPGADAEEPLASPSPNGTRCDPVEGGVAEDGSAAPFRGRRSASRITLIRLPFDSARGGHPS